MSSKWKAELKGKSTEMGREVWRECPGVWGVETERREDPGKWRL